MANALIRLEDIGPGGYYDSAENLMKLIAVADFLYRQGVRFHVAVIPRFVDPKRGIDHSIGNANDPASARFVRALNALLVRGASLGIHGYTHQYGQSVSGEGFEFAYSGCIEDCPPDDTVDSLSGMLQLLHSYAYTRFRMALSAFQAAGLRPEWFETPHYTASGTQRNILETCSWLMYESNPDAPESRQVTTRPSQSTLRKTYYVPTPLGYVSGDAVEQEVNRILHQVQHYKESDLASFFFHPFLEFPYIHLRKNSPPYYEEHSPLKKLIHHLLGSGRQFVSIWDLLPPL